MSTLMSDARAKKVWFDEYNMWVEFTDGRQLSVPLAYFPRLEKATPELRNNFEMSGGGTGIHSAILTFIQYPLAQAKA